ncbi:hypothetical protein D3C79_709910 [compost metagenome]
MTPHPTIQLPTAHQAIARINIQLAGTIVLQRPAPAAIQALDHLARHPAVLLTGGTAQVPVIPALLTGITFANDQLGALGKGNGLWVLASMLSNNHEFHGFTSI